MVPPLPEQTARKILHQAGFTTFKRPRGIPENYIVMISERNEGMIYRHPKHPETSIRVIRVMPGSPSSLFPAQQKPYVKQMINGRSLDKYGNFVSKNSAEAHISLSEYVYIEK